MQPVSAGAGNGTQVIWVLRHSLSADPEASSKTFNHSFPGRVLPVSVVLPPAPVLPITAPHVKASPSDTHYHLFFTISEIKMHPTIDSQI